METKKSIHYYYQYFSRFQLQRIREKNGLTQKALAGLVGCSPSAISQFEAAKCIPDFPTFETFVNVLSTHPANLTSLVDNFPRLKFSSCHFRANRTVSKTGRLKALRYAETVLTLYDALERRGIVFPQASIPVYQGEELLESDIEQYTQEIRKTFHLSLNPIHDMADLLESLGVRIVVLPHDNIKIDAFATWQGNIPCIVIVGSKPASRLQFDYAHELAHLILHTEEIVGNAYIERIANRFASSFLMPKPTYLQDCPPSYSLKKFISVKKFWHVSIAAALYRARQLGILSEKSYKNAMISMAKQGIRHEEPLEFEKPQPTLLRQALECLADDLTLEELANDVFLNIHELISLLKAQEIPEFIIEKMMPKKQKAKISYLSFKKSF